MTKYNPNPSDFNDILTEIEGCSGYTFKNRDILIEAMTHTSYASEHAGCRHNQRLEFLGDAVLQIAVSKELYKCLPDADEGELTRIRSLMAKEHATAEYAIRLHLDKAMLLGNGEIKSGGRERESMLGDLFEAFLGAVFVDGGYEVATALFKSLMPDVAAAEKQLLYEENPKGALQELCQERHHIKPVYVDGVIGGTHHEPCFEVKVYVLDRLLAVGTGSSKKLAEKDGAIKALKEILKSEPEVEQL